MTTEQPGEIERCWLDIRVGENILVKLRAQDRKMAAKDAEIAALRAESNGHVAARVKLNIEIMKKNVEIAALKAPRRCPACLGNEQVEIPEHCERCGGKGFALPCQQCGGPHLTDTSLPSDIWNQIADSGEYLCTWCIDGRLADKGLTCNQAEFYFVGHSLSSKLYDESHGDVARLNREIAAADARIAELRGLINQNWEDPSRSSSYVLPTQVLYRLRAALARGEKP